MAISATTKLSNDVCFEPTPQPTRSVVIYYYVTDSLGTPWRMVDAAGNVVWAASYSTYGEATTDPALTTVDQPLRMPGQYYDQESGLHYNLARYYDPTTGRYLSVDPLRDAEDYGYANGNPLKYSDPRGTDVVLLRDKEGAGGQGHVAALVQDQNGTWYYSSQGAAEQASNFAVLAGSDIGGGLDFSPLLSDKNASGRSRALSLDEALQVAASGRLGSAYDDGILIKTTKQQDAAIFNNAAALSYYLGLGTSKYNVYTNNCADAVQDIVQRNTGIDLPFDIDPRPNEYWKKLKTWEQKQKKR